MTKEELDYRRQLIDEMADGILRIFAGRPKSQRMHKAGHIDVEVNGTKWRFPYGGPKSRDDAMDQARAKAGTIGKIT